MSRSTNAAFLGVDLGWYGKPSGLASIAFDREGLSLRKVTRIEDTEDILRWIKSEAGGGSRRCRGGRTARDLQPNRHPRRRA